MPNPYFRFKQFTINHDQCSMKVTTDSCLFGAWVAGHIRNLDVEKNILDIGSGSGLLSLMIAQQTQALIEGVEIQKDDYVQSIYNISNSPFAKRITIHQVDALQFNYSKKYDVIISNPPFYENDLKSAATGKNIAHHDEGLKLPELLNLIGRQLTVDGAFFLLLPQKRLADLQQLIDERQLFVNEIVSVHQTPHHDAFRIMLRGSFLESRSEVCKIVIKEGTDYSADFTRLLKDYYLYL